MLLYVASGLQASVSIGRVTGNQRGARLYSAYVIMNNYTGTMVIAEKLLTDLLSV